MLPKRFRPPRTAVPVALLLLGMGVMVVVAFQAHRAVRSHQATIEEALLDYAAVTAWSLEHHLATELESALWEHLQAVNHGEGVHSSPNIPPAHELGHYLDWDSAGCLCHRPDYAIEAYFGWTLGSDTIEVAPNLYTGPGVGVVVDRGAQEIRVAEGYPAREPRRYSDEERSWVHETVSGSARSHYRADDRFALVTGEVGGRPLLVGYTLMLTAWGDTVAYAVEMAPSVLASLADRVLDERDILPPVFTREAGVRNLVAAALFRGKGDLLWSTGDEDVRPEDLAGVTWRALPERFGDLNVAAAVLPQGLDALLIGGVPRSRLPVLLAMLALATALALFAFGQLRREARLAEDRAAFVSSVSHELRTPLAQMRLYLDTLRLGRADSEATVQRSLGLIDRETTRLAHLVDNVLRFSGRRAASAPTEAVSALSEEVRETLRSFRPLAEARRVRLTADITPDLRARVDPDGLRQVVLNYLDNAVKYGPTGGEVTVRVAPAAADPTRVVVEVVDAGPGVDRSEHDLIWEPYRRGGTPAAAAAGGSGIGLAVVRDIVRAAGGAVAVDDAPGGGAVFRAEFARG
jgi:signal transduction histidine kinase